MSILSDCKAYLEYPKTYRFDTQQEGEEIALILRKHKFTWLPWLVPSVILLFLPFVMKALLGGRYNFPINIDGGIVTALVLLWVIVVVFYIFEKFLLWYFSADLVTNQRIIDMRFVFPFYKKVSQLSLTRIQDMSDVTNGFFPSVFNYGDLRVETAGETSPIQIVHSSEKDEAHDSRAAAVPDFVFKSVPNLDKVQKIITELSAKQKEQRKEN